LLKPCTIYSDETPGSETFCNDLVFDTSEVGVTLASEASNKISQKTACVKPTLSVNFTVHLCVALRLLASFALQFSLVCEKRQIAATITTMGFVGRLIGSLVIGVLADR